MTRLEMCTLYLRTLFLEVSFPYRARVLESGKGGKGSKGGYGYGGGELEPEHKPEVKGDWEPEPEPVHHESDDYHVYGKSGKGGNGSKGGYENGDGHYAEPEVEPELAGNSGSGDW